MTITLCASASHYRDVVRVRDALRAHGHEVLLPHVAEVMEQTGDYDVDHYKTWFADASDYVKKQELMRLHFSKVLQGDATLVVNMEKRGLKGYVGGNVLMEMAIAFHAGKNIFLLNDVDDALPVLEEVRGLMPIVLDGDLSRIV